MKYLVATNGMPNITPFNNHLIINNTVNSESKNNISKIIMEVVTIIIRCNSNCAVVQYNTMNALIVELCSCSCADVVVCLSHLLLFVPHNDCSAAALLAGGSRDSLTRS